MSLKIGSLYAEVGANVSNFLAGIGKVKTELTAVKGSFEGSFPGDALGKSFESYTGKALESAKAAEKVSVATKAERMAAMELVPGLERAKRATAEFMGANVGLIAVVTAAAIGLKQLWDLSEEGAQLMRLADSGSEAARQLGGDMDLIVSKVKEASLGTVSEMDIIGSANKAMMLGLGADADELASLMEVAAYRGRVMGLDTTKAFDDIVRGIGRTSPLILDNLGIIIDAESTYQDYADSIGKAKNELTKQDKVQALLTKTLSEGNKMLAEAGGLADDNAASFERLGATWKDYFDEFKIGLAPTGAAMANFFTDIIEHEKELARETARAREIERNAIFGYTDAVKDNKAALEELYGVKRRYTDAEIESVTVIDSATQSYIAMAEAERKAADATALATGELNANKDAANGDAGAIYGVRDAVLSLNQAYRGLANFYNAQQTAQFLSQMGRSAGVHRASGGPVSGGSPYMVGERGPEMFVPSSNGNIVPNNSLASASGGNNFYINVTADFADPETIARRLKPAVTRVMREAGVV